MQLFLEPILYFLKMISTRPYHNIFYRKCHGHFPLQPWFHITCIYGKTMSKASKKKCLVCVDVNSSHEHTCPILQQPNQIPDAVLLQRGRCQL